MLEHLQSIRFVCSFRIYLCFSSPQFRSFLSRSPNTSRQTSGIRLPGIWCGCAAFINAIIIKLPCPFNASTHALDKYPVCMCERAALIMCATYTIVGSGPDQRPYYHITLLHTMLRFFHHLFHFSACHAFNSRQNWNKTHFLPFCFLHSFVFWSENGKWFSGVHCCDANLLKFDLICIDSECFSFVANWPFLKWYSLKFLAKVTSTNKGDLMANEGNSVGKKKWKIRHLTNPTHPTVMVGCTEFMDSNNRTSK